MAETNLWERVTQSERERGIIESTEYREIISYSICCICNGNV